MKRRDFLKIFGIGLAASVATRAAKARVCERANGFLDRVYPVGSIYITITSTNPGTTLGGTWVRFGNGRTLIGVDETSLGAADPSGGRIRDFRSAQLVGGHNQHTLTEAQMPAHNHTMLGQWFPTAGHDLPGFRNVTGQTNMSTNNTGGGQAHNNLPPYITVFMWRRSA